MSACIVVLALVLVGVVVYIAWLAYQLEHAPEGPDDRGDVE